MFLNKYHQLHLRWHLVIILVPWATCHPAVGPEIYDISNNSNMLFCPKRNRLQSPLWLSYWYCIASGLSTQNMLIWWNSGSALDIWTTGSSEVKEKPWETTQSICLFQSWVRNNTMAQRKEALKNFFNTTVSFLKLLLDLGEASTGVSDVLFKSSPDTNNTLQQSDMKRKNSFQNYFCF